MAYTNVQRVIADEVRTESKRLTQNLFRINDDEKREWTRRERARITRLLDELVQVNNLLEREVESES